MPQLIRLFRKRILTFPQRLLGGCNRFRPTLDTPVLLSLLNGSSQPLFGLTNRLIHHLLDLVTRLLHGFCCRLVVKPSFVPRRTRQVICDLLNILGDSLLFLLRSSEPSFWGLKCLLKPARICQLIRTIIQLLGLSDGILGIAVGKLGFGIGCIELWGGLIFQLFEIGLSLAGTLIRHRLLLLALLQQTFLVIQIRFRIGARLLRALVFRSGVRLRPGGFQFVLGLRHPLLRLAHTFVGLLLRLRRSSRFVLQRSSLLFDKILISFLRFVLSRIS